jgi:hypothetical protein
MSPTSNNDQRMQLLPQTIAVICVLSIISLLTLIIYSIILLKFLCDNDLQVELTGGESDRLRNEMKEKSHSKGTTSSVPKPQLGTEAETLDETSTITGSKSIDINHADINITTTPPVMLSFHSITYTVNGKDKKQILKDVSGWFAPKTLTAILGTSGEYYT